MFVNTSDEADSHPSSPDNTRVRLHGSFSPDLGEDYHPPEVTDAISSVYRSSGEEDDDSGQTMKDRLPPNKANQPHSVTTNTPGSGADNPLVGSNPTVGHCEPLFSQEALAQVLAVSLEVGITLISQQYSSFSAFNH
jgi:hypothetical protein